MGTSACATNTDSGARSESSALTPACATSIADARSKPVGTQVTVDGFVTVAPGTFASATGEEGFAIQDDSAGIYVSLAQKLGFAQGDHLQVTGTIDTLTGLLVIQGTPSSVSRLPGFENVPPRHVTTGNVGPSTEGLLTWAKGTVTQAFQDDSPYGYKLYFNDGSGEVQIYVHTTTGIDPAALKRIQVGQTLRVTGFASRYEDVYELDPRSAADIAGLE